MNASQFLMLSIEAMEHMEKIKLAYGEMVAKILALPKDEAIAHLQALADLHLSLHIEVLKQCQEASQTSSQ